MRTAGMTIACVGTVALLALTGCSKEQPAAAAHPGSRSAPSTTSASGTRSAPPTATTTATPIHAGIPPAARAHTTEGAKAFAVHWVESVGHGLLNGSSEQIRALSAPACRGCGALIGFIDELAAKKQRATVAPYLLKSSNAAPGTTADKVLLDAVMTESPFKIVDSSGKLIRSSAGGGIALKMTIGFVAGRWVATEVLGVV